MICLLIFDLSCFFSSPSLLFVFFSSDDIIWCWRDISSSCHLISSCIISNSQSCFSFCCLFSIIVHHILKKKSIVLRSDFCLLLFARLNNMSIDCPKRHWWHPPSLTLAPPFIIDLLLLIKILFTLLLPPVKHIHVMNRPQRPIGFFNHCMSDDVHTSGKGWTLRVTRWCNLIRYTLKFLFQSFCCPCILWEKSDMSKHDVIPVHGRVGEYCLNETNHIINLILMKWCSSCAWLWGKFWKLWQWWLQFA